jgi:hypothetical protein
MGRKNAAVIFDGDQHRMIMLEPSDKKAILMTEEDMKQMNMMTEAMVQKYRKSQSGKPGEGGEENVKFAPTGRTETVAGVKCQVWQASTVSEGKKKEGEACLADGVGFAAFNMMENPMLTPHGKQARWMEEYRKVVGPNKGVVKIVEKTDGNSRTVMEAIKIQRMPVGRQSFEPPPGYSEVNMHDQLMQMQQGMQGMQQMHDSQ